MMRVSLYKHELETLRALTVDILRESARHCEATEDVDNPPWEIGPRIFLALADGLYSRGNWKQVRWEDSHAPRYRVEADRGGEHG